MKVRLIRETPNPVETIANIAEICYGKDKAKNPKKLVEKSIEGKIFETLKLRKDFTDRLFEESEY